MSRCEKTRSIQQPEKKTPLAGNFVIFCSDCGVISDATFLFSQGVKRDIADLRQSSGLLVITSTVGSSGLLVGFPWDDATHRCFLGAVGNGSNESGFLEEVVGGKGLVV